jgi:hypothetical protein
MTKDETIKVLALLNAFYAGGKGDPKQQAVAWHLVLGKYEYADAVAAVIRFAENDTRDYATFPAVGKIVEEIRAESIRKRQQITEVIRSVSYGKDYADMSNEAKALVPRPTYETWLKMDAEIFASKTDVYADILRRSQKRLLTGVEE